jgi:single-strand DNA-binding protein
MINTAILLGRVGKKETKPLKSGTGQYTLLSVATTKYIKDAQGGGKEETTWHNCTCFAKISDYADKFINVGDVVFIEGDIMNRKVQQQDREVYLYSVHINKLKLVPNANKDYTKKADYQNNRQNYSQSNQGNFGAQGSFPNSANQGAQPSGNNFYNDDIPF